MVPRYHARALGYGNVVKWVDVSSSRIWVVTEVDSHITWELIEFALARRIVCFCLPPHPTHLLQPLDVGLFGPYAVAYSRVMDDASRRGVTGVDKCLFMENFQIARKEMMTERHCRSAFRQAGIYPFNPDRVIKELSERKANEARIDAVNTETTTATAVEIIAATPHNTRAVRGHVSVLLDVLDTLEAQVQGIAIDTPNSNRVKQLGKSAEMSMIRESVQIETNRQLREENRRKKASTVAAGTAQPGDRTVLAKGATGGTVLTWEKAQELRKRAEEKLAAEIVAKARLSAKQQEKAFRDAMLNSPIGGMWLFLSQ